VRGAGGRELDRRRGAEELRLEAAPVAAVQADEVLDRAAVLQVRDARERQDRRFLLDTEVPRTSAFAARASIERTPRWSLRPSSCS
jgi:hypothetical protein